MDTDKEIKDNSKESIESESEVYSNSSFESIETESPSKSMKSSNSHGSDEESYIDPTAEK